MSASKRSLLLGIADRLDALATGIGRTVAYFTVATVLVCFLNVYLRYALGVGFVWLQESYIWTHVAAIMFGSSYALSQGAFVRVDPVYNRMSERGKAWVDLFGTVVFLGPFMFMMGYSGWSFFLASWKMSERSAYESGLPAIYLLKGTLLIFVALVSLQGIAIVCRCLLTLLGYGKRPASPMSAESF